MVFYPTSGFYKCFRCAAIGNVNEDGVLPARSGPRPEPERGLAPAEIEGFLSFADEDVASSVRARPFLSYLEGRGVPRSTAVAAGIGFCAGGELDGRVVVPLVDASGELWGAVGRVPAGGHPLPYRTLNGMARDKLFNEAALDVDTDEPVLVVEGVFDALPHWPDVVACLGKPHEPQVRRLAAARRPVAVALDGDAWRESEALSMRLQIMGARSGFVRLPGGADPNDVDPGWLRAKARECTRRES